MPGSANALSCALERAAAPAQRTGMRRGSFGAGAGRNDADADGLMATSSTVRVSVPPARSAWRERDSVLGERARPVGQQPSLPILIVNADIATRGQPRAPFDWRSGQATGSTDPTH